MGLAIKAFSERFWFMAGPLAMLLGLLIGRILFGPLQVEAVENVEKIPSASMVSVKASIPECERVDIEQPIIADTVKGQTVEAVSIYELQKWVDTFNREHNRKICFQPVLLTQAPYCDRVWIVTEPQEQE